MKKTSSQMLIESGILPKNGVAQLQRLKLVPENTLSQLGASPVSFEKDAREASRFAAALQSRLDEEDVEIKETELEPPGQPRSAYIVWGDNSLDTSPCTVIVDKLGRVHVPMNTKRTLAKKKIKAISFTPTKKGATPIDNVEPRYSGDKLQYLVCTLRT